MYRDNPLDRHEYERLTEFLQDSQTFNAKRAQKTVVATKRIMSLVRRTIQEAIEIDVGFSGKVSSSRLIKWTFAALAMLETDFSLTGREHLLAKGLRDYHSAREQEESPEWRAYLVTGRTGRIDTDAVRFCLEQIKSRMIHAAGLQPRDPQRFFSAEQRADIYEKSGGSCERCGLELSETNFHADHIVPYSQNGQTIVENGQALCIACNLGKSAAA